MKCGYAYQDVHLLHDKLTIKYHSSNNLSLTRTSCGLSQAQHIYWTVSHTCHFASSLRRVTKGKELVFCPPFHLADFQATGQIRKAKQIHRGRNLAFDT